MKKKKKTAAKQVSLGPHSLGPLPSTQRHYPMLENWVVSVQCGRTNPTMPIGYYYIYLNQLRDRLSQSGNQFVAKLQFEQALRLQSILIKSYVSIFFFLVGYQSH